MKNKFLLISFLFVGFLNAQQIKLQKYKVTELSSKIEENSGLTILNDNLYTINDSGGEAEIYQINTKDGSVAETLQVNARNFDWEAISTDGENFYVGDFGNNWGTRKDLKVYKVSSTNPQEVFMISYVYPQQDNFEKRPYKHDFDAEAMIFLDDKIHVFSKEWSSKKVTRYELDPSKTDQQAQKKEDYFVGYVVTDAAYYNGKLYLVGYNRKGKVFLSIFDRNENGFFFSSAEKRFSLGNAMNVGQIEGITVDEEGIFISGERFKKAVVNAPQTLYKIPHKDVK